MGEKTNAKATARGSKEAREKRDQANIQDGSAPSETPVRRSAEKPSKDIKKPTAQRISTDREPAGETTRASGQTATDGTAGKGKKASAQGGNQKASAGRGGNAESNRAAAAREKVARSLASGGAQAKEALGQTEALTGIALGCFLAWVPMTFQSLNIVGDAGEPVLDAVYLISILALLATQIFIGVRHAQCGRWIARRPVRVGAAAVMMLSTLLLPLAAGSAGDGLPLGSFALGAFATEAAGVLSGVSSGIFLAQFGILVSKFSAKATAAIAAIGYILMSALFCVYSFFGPLESCLFAASMPAISAFLRDLGASTAKGKAAISERALPMQALPENADDRRNLNHLTITLALSSALIGCANELARTLYIQMGIAGSGSGNYALIQAGGALIVGLGATIIMLALVSMKTPKAPEYCYRIVLLFLVLGSLLLPTPLIYPIGVITPYAINAASFQCFGIMAWVLICGTCHQYPTASVRTFSLIRAGWTFGPIVGLLIGRFVVHYTPFGLPEVFACALVGGVFAMLTTMTFTERDLAFAVNLLPTDKKRRFTDKCLAVAARCGLSERETEIMTLFAKGRNLAYIQEQLCLSKSTVSTHRQHIYQKLGVHSSQEMIDLIQEEKA